jgi:hypothetical protein
LGRWRPVSSVAALGVVITVVPLISATIIVHLSSSGHIRPHCKIAERLRVFFRTLALALVVVILVIIASSLVLVIVMILIVALVISTIVMVGIVRVCIVVSSVS